jgi:integrase
LVAALSTLCHASRDALVFVGPRGGDFDLDNFRKRVWAELFTKDAMRGVEYRPLYQCRHTFATLAIMGGMRAADVAACLGDRVRTVEDRYYRWLGGADPDAIDNAIDGARPALAAVKQAKTGA